MPTPAIAKSNRYFDVGITKCYYLPTIAAASLTPTRAEMDAGKDLSGEVAALDGWVVEAGEIETPDLATEFTGKIPGRTQAEDCSLTLHADKTGNDVRTLLPRGTEGYIMWCDGGDVAGNKADVFPIRVRANSAQRSVEDENARRMVSFSVTRKPAESVTIPSTV